MELNEAQKARIFDSLFKEYVLEHGLGGMAKSDFDALFLWLVVYEIEDIDSFKLSSEFKIKEGRVKSLLETAAVKFEKLEEAAAWRKLLVLLEAIEYDIESLEKGQIRFQLKNPMLFRWLQAYVRGIGATCYYHRSSEQVTMNLDTIFKIFDGLWGPGAFDDTWKQEDVEFAQPLIQKTIGSICAKIEENSLENLRKRKKGQLWESLQRIALLGSVGDQIEPLWNLAQDNLA